MRSQWVLLFYGYCTHICINPAFTWCFDLKTQLFNIFLHAEIRWGDFFTQWNYYDFSKLGIHCVYVCVAFELAQTFGVTFGDGWGAEFHAAEHPQYNVGLTTGDPCSCHAGKDLFEWFSFFNNKGKQGVPGDRVRLAPTKAFTVSCDMKVDAYLAPLIVSGCSRSS